MGGLSKKSQQIVTLTDQDHAPAMLLDAGNLLFRRPTMSHGQELITAAGLMRIYQQMAYDGVAVGPRDLAAGIDPLKNSLVQGFPWLSANLRDKEGKTIFPATKIIERSGLTIGLIGLTGQMAEATQKDLVADWREVLPEHLEHLRQKCQLVIVLSSLAEQDNREITEQYPQVHILITADGLQGNVEPYLAGKTLVTQTMNQGKYLGVLTLDWLPGGFRRPGSQEGDAQLGGAFTGSFIALTKNLPEDPRIATLVDEVKAEIANLNRQK